MHHEITKYVNLKNGLKLCSHVLAKVLNIFQKKNDECVFGVISSNISRNKQIPSHLVSELYDS